MTNIHEFPVCLKVGDEPLQTFNVNLSFLELVSKINDGYRPNKHDKNTIVILEEMESYLRNARNWGNWDMMGGRGMTTYVKHSNIDKARARLHKAQHLLNRFENELRDVYNPRQLNLSLNLDSFTRFIDIFFDNLISDWVVQQRIRNALSNVVSVKDKASRLIGTLEMDDKDLVVKMKQLEKEKKQLVLNFKG